MMKGSISLCVCAVLAALLVAQSAPANLLVNGDFATDLSGWTIQSGTGTVAITWAAGTARWDKAVGAANSNYLYQVIPVTIGQTYLVNAEWSGDLLTGATAGRNWAEVFIGFSATLPTAQSGSIMYKKATNTNLNVPPTSWTMESILLSPNNTSTPAGGAFVATGNYMTISFNLGGNTTAPTPAAFMNVDNVSVVPEPATMAILGLGGLFLRRRLA